MRQQLGAAGLAAAQVEDTGRLFDAAIDLLHRTAGRMPDRAWWIPGRLEVFGKHTDYAGGHSLVCAVPRGFALVARGRDDRTVRLLDAVRGEACMLRSPSSPAAVASAGETMAHSGWRRYAEVAVARLARNFPGAQLGADIAFASDLPSASGMSSSSALVTGVAAALSELAGLRQRTDWQRDIRTRADEAGYYACIENGAAFGGLAGDTGVGTHGGSEDHAAIVCGRPDVLTAWRFVPLSEVTHAPLPPAWTFVVLSSGVAARKAGEAREAYNRLSRLATALVGLWRRDGSHARSLGDALESSAGAMDRLLALVRQTGADAHPLERRLQHFVREDARVLEAVDACRTGDARRLGELGDASQADAEALLGNQVAETIALARRARTLGAFAASSFGAGFGGSVWALVERQNAPTFADAWLADYRASFPGRAAATVFVARPGPPLTPLRMSGTPRREGT